MRSAAQQAVQALGGGLFFFVWLATGYYWLYVLWKTERPSVDIAQGSESRLGREGFRGWGKDGG